MLGAFLAAAALGGALAPRSIVALPPQFLLQPTGNERNVTWRRLETEHFTVYHDARSPDVARTALTAAENAYRDLSLLLGVKIGGDSDDAKPFPKDFVRSRFERVPLVVSTQADAAAFANFSTQNIDLPISFGAPASLFQHELVHRLMYEHFDPGLGVAGRGFSIAMLPTWWMEGLPEYLTESNGRLETRGVARTMAREDSFLTFDRMHALYKASGDVFVRGYVTAGRFFGFLAERFPEKDLARLHEDFFWKTMTPPFVNATNRVIGNAFDKWPSEMYSEYKAHEKAYWKGYLAGMPGAVPRNALAWVVSSGTPNAVTLDGEILLSALTVPPRSSAFFHNKGETIRTVDDAEEKAQKEDELEIKGRRLPVGLEGGGTFDVHPAELENGAFWTARAQDFSNGTWGHELRYVSFEGALSSVDDDALAPPIDIPLATGEDPHVVRQIFSFGAGRAFAITNLRGRPHLFALSARKRKAVLVKSWESPVSVRLAQRARSGKAVERATCAALVIDHDYERTSLERVCSDGRQEVLLPSESQYVRGAVENADGSFVLLVGWDEVLGLARFDKGKVEPIAPFPEWVESIRPWGDTGDVGLWKFDGYDNLLYRVNLATLAANYATWKQRLPADSPWLRGPSYVRYLPPFATLAARKRGELSRASGVKAAAGEYDVEGGSPTLVAAANAGAGPQEASKKPPEVGTGARNTGDARSAQAPTTVLAPTPVPEQSLEQRGIATVEEDATYRHSHWFTYPLVYPPPIDDWSVGLVSVPFNEEMERQRFQIMASYNFFTRAVSGTASYVNQRIFDAFQIDAFSRERYNGIYFKRPGCTGDRSCYSTLRRDRFDGYLSYLREQGVGLYTSHTFRPTSVGLSTRFQLFVTRPLSGTPSPVIGAQEATVGQVGGTLSFTLFEASFYDRGARTGGSWIDWKTSASGGADTFRSIGAVRAGDGSEVGALEYQSYDAGLSSSVAYKGKALTLRGNLSTTQGMRSFLLKEQFQPYRTYLLGSQAGLNNVNLPIAGDFALFARRGGTWVYRTTLDYTFPIIDELDTQFYILYFETLRGELVLGRGGYTPESTPAGFTNVDSASAAVRMTIDVKGVQVFPSLAYGKILGAPGWSLFTELSFTEFF